MYHQLNNPTNADIAQFVQQRALDVETWGIERSALSDEQAAERAARDYVDMLARAGAPAAGTAAGLLAVGCAHPVPLDPESFAPTAKPFTTFAAIAEHYDSRPHDGCGVMAGPQPGGNVLVALKTTPEAWDEWLRAHALEVREVRRRRPRQDGHVALGAPPRLPRRHQVGAAAASPPPLGHSDRHRGHPRDDGHDDAPPLGARRGALAVGLGVGRACRRGHSVPWPEARARSRARHRRGGAVVRRPC